MSNTATQHYDIVEHNIVNFVKELEARLLDGWAVSKTNPGDVVGLYGGTFTVSLYRDASTVERVKSKVESVAEQPKPDRKTILANARAAKAFKKQNAVKQSSQK